MAADDQAGGGSGGGGGGGNDPAGPADPDAPEDTRGWVVVQFFNEDGQPLMARIKQYEAGFPRGRYPHRIDVFWPASEGAENGVPTPEDIDAMAVFENRLCAALEPDRQSTLSLVITGGGEREWVFHTEDPQVFLSRLSEMPHEDGRYPIEIQHEEDPDWTLFDAYQADDEPDGAPPGVTLH